MLRYGAVCLATLGRQAFDLWGLPSSNDSSFIGTDFQLNFLKSVSGARSYLMECMASEYSDRVKMKEQNKCSQCEYALANVQTYDDTHLRNSRQSGFPLGRVQSGMRCRQWRQIQNLPNPRPPYCSATFTNGRRPFKCAHTLQDPT